MGEQSIRLAFPANASHLVLARAAVAAVCARLDFPLERLDDVKLAIDEACAMLLPDAVPDSQLRVNLLPRTEGEVAITITATTRHGRTPRKHTFSWTVLSALVDSVEATVQDSAIVTIRMTATRTPARSDS